MNNRDIWFSDSSELVDFVQLQKLFETSAFWAKDRTIEDLRVAIENSNPVITAWDRCDQGKDKQKLIGHARATSDLVYRATIWDVVIDPEYRGAGLGRKLVQTVLSHPRICNVEKVYLMTTHQTQFYQNLGFEFNSSTTLVLLNNYDKAKEISLIQSTTD